MIVLDSRDVLACEHGHVAVLLQRFLLLLEVVFETLQTFCEFAFNQSWLSKSLIC
jgi:hypothetical protein